MKTLLSLFVLFWALSASLFGQTVRGFVYDKTNGEALFGATINIEGTTTGTATEPDGSFAINLNSNSVRLVVRFLGYRELRLQVSSSEKPLMIYLQPESFTGAELFVEAGRVDKNGSVAFNTIEKEELETSNLGRDIPMLLNGLPSVITTSDAGAGIGYTGIRIRGIDQARINVTINGIPVNDAESHGVFWVDLPDLASSIESIQVQRGVGTSTNGAGAFGATINLETAVPKNQAFAEVNTGIGSFGTQRYNLMMGTGLLANGWQAQGRVSKIDSDGFIDRATSDLKSFYVSASKTGNKSFLKADVFFGKEVTFQAWNGVPEPILEGNEAETERFISQLFLNDRDAAHWRQNIGNRRFNQFTFDNQVDDYRQDYYQLHYSYNFRPNWVLNTSLHYTRGKGFFEEFVPDQSPDAYGLRELFPDAPETTDIVRRQWLDNDFYGLVFSNVINTAENSRIIIGGAANEYRGDHFGRVMQTGFTGNTRLNFEFFFNNAVKTDLNTYVKAEIPFGNRLKIFADAQIRSVRYRFEGPDLQLTGNTSQIVNIDQTDNLFFFNPKLGFNLAMGESSRIYGSFGVASKEPTREEYVNSTPASRPEHETLFDYELGYRAEFEQFFFSANAFYMFYRDQLVATGAVNDVGAFTRQNVDKSYRTGMELEAGYRLNPSLEWAGNIALSKNKIKEFTNSLSNFDTGLEEQTTLRNKSIAFSPETVASSVVRYRKQRLAVEWSTKYVSRQYLDNTQTQSRSIDPYITNDLLISYTVKPGSVLRGLTASLQVNNILDERFVASGYTFGWIAEGREQHFNFFYPQATRNFLAQLKWEF